MQTNVIIKSEGPAFTADTINRALLSLRKIMAASGTSREIKTREHHRSRSEKRRDRAVRARCRDAKAARRRARSEGND